MNYIYYLNTYYDAKSTDFRLASFWALLSFPKDPRHRENTEVQTIHEHEKIIQNHITSFFITSGFAFALGRGCHHQAHDETVEPKGLSKSNKRGNMGCCFGSVQFFSLEKREIIQSWVGWWLFYAVWQGWQSITPLFLGKIVNRCFTDIRSVTPKGGRTTCFAP